MKRVICLLLLLRTCQPLFKSLKTVVMPTSARIHEYIGDTLVAPSSNQVLHANHKLDGSLKYSVSLGAVQLIPKSFAVVKELSLACVASDFSKIFLVDVTKDSFTTIALTPPDYNFILISRIEAVPSSVYIVAISDYTNDWVFLDVSNPTGKQLWGKSSTSSLKELAISPRLVAIVNEQGTEINTVSLGDKRHISTFTQFSQPSSPVILIAHYSMFNDLDLFFLIGSDLNRSNRLLIADFGTTTSTIIREISIASVHPTMSVFAVEHIKNTNYAMLAFEDSVRIINLRTDTWSPVLSSPLITDVRFVPGTHLISIISGSATPQVFLFEILNDVCNVLCEACEQGIINNNCTKCSAAATLIPDKTCTRKCVSAGSYVEESSGTCSFAEDDMHRVDAYTLAKNKIGDCQAYHVLGHSCQACKAVQGEPRLAVNKGAELACVQTCPRSTYHREGKCEPCHLACDGCEGPGVSKCTGCGEGFVMREGVCSSNCLQGYYYSPVKKSCQRCARGCERCTAGDVSKCELCLQGYFRNGGYCSTTFPDGFIPVVQDRSYVPCFGASCPPCPSTHIYRFEGRCITACPEGTGAGLSGRCFPCHDVKCEYLVSPELSVYKAATGVPISPEDLDDDSEVGSGWFFVMLAVFGFMTIVCLLWILLYRCCRKVVSKGHVEYKPVFAETGANRPGSEGSRPGEAANQGESRPSDL